MSANLDVAQVMALPGKYYTCAETYRLTRERVLDRAWHYVCHETNVPESGDYYAFTLLDENLFVVRGRDGVVRCFYNVCQHRGHALVSDTGRTSTIVCPYHAWAYQLDGKLKGAPAARNVPGFDKSKVCLTEVRLEIFLGFVFVNFDDNAPTMRERYAGVEGAVRAHCPDIEKRIFAYEHDCEELCNWLVAVENYNECYHCGNCHKSFASGVIDPKSYDIQPFGDGPVLQHSAKAATGEHAWYDTSGADYASFYLFPCFSLQLYPSGLVNTYYWRPLSVDNTEVHRGWFSFDGVVDDEMQAVIDLDRDSTFTEDLALVRSVQRGLSSRGYRPGPLVVSSKFGINSEHSLAALHRWVREAVDHV